MNRAANRTASGRASATTRRSTWGERAIVLGGPAIAALWTAVSLMLDTGMETVGAAWTIGDRLGRAVSSFALALRRGIPRAATGPPSAATGFPATAIW